MLQGLTILVAEDNPVNLKVIDTTLRRQGATVTLTSNGRELVEALSRRSYDLVLIDLHMPVMDGFEATRHIRRELNSKVPVMALSADALVWETDKCAEAGMNDYLSKPFNPAELFDKILALTGNKTAATYAASAVQPAADPMIDLSYLGELSANDPAYRAEVISIFLRSVPTGLDNLASLVTQPDDFDSVYRQAHQLKSSFSVVRVGDIYEQLLLLEKAAAEQQDIALVQQIFERIRSTFHHALPALQGMSKPQQRPL